MINGKIIGGREVIQRLLGVAPKLSTKLDVTIARLTILLQRTVVQTKLQGQVLKVRSGRLQRSITPRITGQGTGAVTGTVGTNVVYARKFEYGFSGDEQVKAHLRTITQAWGKPLAAPMQVQVRDYTRHIEVPEKSFLRSALRDIAPTIRSELKQAVHESIAK